MSELSDLLNRFMKEKEIPSIQIVQGVDIDRSTVYQYLRGRREIKNRAHLEAICAILRLTPEEHQQITRAFHMAAVGPEQYAQWEKLEDMFTVLSRVEEQITPLEIDLQIQLPDEGRVFTGFQEVARISGAVLTDAMGGARCDILLQPSASLLSALILAQLRPEGTDTPVRHVICMESNAKTGVVQNIEILQELLRHSVALRNYSPIFYYGSIPDHFGTTNILPGLIVSDRAALTISGDATSGMLYRAPEAVALFQRRFDQIASVCRPLLSYTVAPPDAFQYSLRFYHQHVKSTRTTMEYGFCCSPFLDKYLLDKYLNPAVAAYGASRQVVDVFVDQITAYCKKYGSCHICAVENIDELLETGYFSDFPRLFMRTPLSPADRCYFLRKILQAMTDGWHSLHLLKENRGLLSAKWSACFTPGTALYIQRKMESGDCFVICPEPGITAAAWNYYQAILQSDRVTTKAETMALLEERVQSFLADQG